FAFGNRQAPQMGTERFPHERRSVETSLACSPIGRPQQLLLNHDLNGLHTVDCIQQSTPQSTGRRCSSAASACRPAPSSPVREHRCAASAARPSAAAASENVRRYHHSMSTFIALLRAVNVGGTGKLPMTDLTRLCSKAGLANVQTYIASGNVVFDSSLSAR